MLWHDKYEAEDINMVKMCSSPTSDVGSKEGCSVALRSLVKTLDGFNGSSGEEVFTYSNKYYRPMMGVTQHSEVPKYSWDPSSKKVNLTFTFRVDASPEDFHSKAWFSVSSVSKLNGEWRAAKDVCGF